MRSLARALAPGRALACGSVFALVIPGMAWAQLAPPAPPAPPVPAVAPAPPALPPSAEGAALAGQPLRQQIEARFEVLPVSDGLLLRPRQPMDGIRALEVRDGELAIDGHPAEADDLERRIGVAAAAPVRALLELDPDELRDMFDLSAAPAPTAADESLDERLQREMDEQRSEIDRRREEMRQRIEQEMERRGDDLQRRQEEALARSLERMAHRSGHRERDARVVMGTPVHVAKGETTGDVVAIGGGVTVDGEVMGDAVSVGGSARIDGPVTGSVVAVGGGVRLGPNARVMQDVVSVGGSVDRDPGAEVLGQVTEISLWQGMFGNFGGLRIPSVLRGLPVDESLPDLLRCVVVVVFLLLLGSLMAAVAPDKMERISYRIALEPLLAGIAGLAGLVIFVFGLVMVTILLAISILGIPLILLVPFAVLAAVVASIFSYYAAGHALARWSERRFGWRTGGTVRTAILGFFVLQGPWIMARLLDVVDTRHDFVGFLTNMLWLFWLTINVCAGFAGVGGLVLARLRGPAAAGIAPPMPPPLPPTSGPPRLQERSAPAGPSAPPAPQAEEPSWEQPFAELSETESTSGLPGEPETPEAPGAPEPTPGGLVDESEEEGRPG